MKNPEIAFTPTIEGVLRELDSAGDVTAAEIVRHILRRHKEYASRTAADVETGVWPEFEKTQPVFSWLEDVRSMFDGTLVDRLHGKLVILGLCRLDPELGEFLRSFSADLRAELLEDFDSLLLPEHAGKESYRRDFLKILQNRAKYEPDPYSDLPPRKTGFLILTRGGLSLEILNRLCFQQRYNSCLTARYELTGGDTFASLNAKMKADLQGIATGDFGTLGAFLPELGRTQRPGTVRTSWQQALRPPDPETLKSDVDTEAMVDISSLIKQLMESTNGAGQRVVFFVEWRGVPLDATVESLGLNAEVLELFADMSERVGFVISGLPEQVRAAFEGETVYQLQLPKDDVPRISQPLLNDTPQGPDRLKIIDEVQALADAIALKDMHPPLVVGVFGGWGAGKSFVLHLIEDRLQEIRCRPVTTNSDGSDSFPFVGHPYLIRFDAWTYAKGNLWASLMQTTLVELDEQLSLEQELGKKLELNPREGSDIWRLLSGLSDTQRDRLLKSELGVAAIATAERFANSGSQGCLWEELEKLREAEKQQLNTEEDKLRELQSAEIEAQRKLESSVDEELGSAARYNAWLPIWDEISQYSKTSLEQTDPPSFDAVYKSIPILRKFWVGLKQLTLPAALFMIVSLVAGFAFTHANPILEKIASIAGVLAAALAPVLRAVEWYGERQKAYQARLVIAEQKLDARREARLAERIDTADPAADTPAAVLQRASEQVQKSKARIEKIRDRLGVTGHSRSLNDFLRTRIDEGLYQKELGIVDQVQSDIQELSNTLLPTQSSGVVDKESLSELFPRGDPRVVLLIDDLDRCPPDKVVEVLEAAQLLVKTRLFVVVIAMDVRYVTRALEAQYKDVLIRSGEPSGLDYIEKIIQIPYRVRTVSAGAIRSFLREQMDIDEPTETERNADAENEGAENSASTEESADTRVKKAGLSTSARKAVSETTEELPEIVRFKPEEYTAISDACSALSVSPRTMKRLVNVFKLLKIIWYRQGLADGPSAAVKQAMLSLLALCARYPEVLRKLLADMETTYRSKSMPGSQPLVEFLIDRASRGAATALYPPDWNRVVKALEDDTFFPEEVTFSRLEEANLHLLTSFSFVGETDAEREATLQRGYYKNATVATPKQQKGSEPFS